jgi:hypothetical protein
MGPQRRASRVRCERCARAEWRETASTVWCCIEQRRRKTIAVWPVKHYRALNCCVACYKHPSALSSHTQSRRAVDFHLGVFVDGVLLMRCHGFEPSCRPLQRESFGTLIQTIFASTSCVKALLPVHRSTHQHVVSLGIFRLPHDHISPHLSTALMAGLSASQPANSLAAE